MKIQEIEQALDFMQLIGYSPSLGASLLSDYFTLRAEGQTPDKAAEYHISLTEQSTTAQAL